MKRLSAGRLNARHEGRVVNPMEGIANLSDVMLVLAVGIMLALVMHWNVDIGAMAHQGAPQTSDVDTENALMFESDDIEKLESEAEEVDGSGLAKLGTVYYNEATGKYYIIDDAQ